MGRPKKYLNGRETLCCDLPVGAKQRLKELIAENGQSIPQWILAKLEADLMASGKTIEG